MPFFLLFLSLFGTLSLAACQGEDSSPTAKENLSTSSPPANLSQKGGGWEEVFKEVIYDPATAKGVGPYERSLEGTTLKLTLTNKEPFNDLSFETFLVELAERLRPRLPPFKVVILQARGTAKTLYQARIEMTDVQAYRTHLISRPELVRRFQIEVKETLESLKEAALTARKEGRTSDALSALEKWIQRDPLSDGALSLLGNVYRDEKRYWDAIGVYQKLQGRSREPEASTKELELFLFHNLGFCYERVGAYEDSAANYKKGLEIDPNNKILIRQLADVSRKDGQFPEALEWIKKGRETGDSAELWLIEGNIYRDSKKYKQAREAYLKAKTLDSQNSKALFNLLLVDLDTKQYGEAKKKYEELKKKDPLVAQQLGGVSVLQEE